ncbi:MAG TPA: hypothetical protein VFI38_04855 [Candidatus Acidoferrum sp.]|nr:hypothetical protein [Candidatus Acidoferrum sp.]
MAYPVAYRLLKLCVGPRTGSCLFVWCDVWVRQAFRKWHSIKSFVFYNFPRAFGSRFWLPQSLFEVMLSMTLEAVRNAFHQISSAFQAFGGRDGTESRGIGIWRKTRGCGLWLCKSELRGRPKEKNQKKNTNTRLGRAETHGTTSVL